METRDNNTLALEWCWNENAAVVNYDILQMGPGGANTQTQTVLGNLPAVVNETVNISNAEEGTYTIQVSSLDACDRIFDSNQISTIVISANPIAESTLELIWSDYNYIDASLTKYKLHQVKDGEDKIIFEGLGNSFTVEDFVDGVETCFYLEACAEGTLLDGSSKSTLVISNTACSNGFPIVRLPNAFNPYGFNTIFKPLFANTSVITSYEMNIFSRYGEQLFVTEALEEGWDGRSGLKEMPQGVYTYLVKIELMGGQTLIRQGSVLLIR